jgi:TatA/E family protein of Tat protein translocase
VLPGFGPLHVLVVLVVALLVLGPTKLPELARHMGAALNVYREFRDRVHTELNPRAVIETMLDGGGPAPRDGVVEDAGPVEVEA